MERASQLRAGALPGGRVSVLRLVETKNESRHRDATTYSFMILAQWGEVVWKACLVSIRPLL